MDLYIFIVAEVDNRTHILEPMTYTALTMQMGAPYRCLTVPLAAMADAARDKVFTVDDEGILHLKHITVGADDGKNIEIRSGLNPGDMVVIGSLDALEEGMKAEINLEGDDG